MNLPLGTAVPIVGVKSSILPSMGARREMRRAFTTASTLENSSRRCTGPTPAIARTARPNTDFSARHLYRAITSLRPERKRALGLERIGCREGFFQKRRLSPHIKTRQPIRGSGVARPDRGVGS